MSGPTIMMQLGNIQFGINTAAYQTLTRTAEYVWGEQERFGKNPALQFTGVSAESVTIEGAFYPEFRGKFDQISNWRDAASAGVPYTLVDGRGKIFGDWVIESIEDRQSIFAEAGAARKNEFTMRLKFYDDGDFLKQLSAQNDVRKANGLLSDTAAANSIASNAETASSGIAGTISNAISGIHAIADEVSQTVQPAIDAATRAITIARTIQNSALQAQRLVKQVKSINSLSSAQSALSGLTATTNNAANAGANLSQVMKGIGIQFSSEPASAQAAIKTALVSINQMTSTAASINSQSSAIIRKYQ